MEHELGPQHVAMNSEANGGMMAAVGPAHVVSDTTTAAATNLNFGISGGGGAASASASNDRDVLGAPPSPDDASRSTTPPDREVYPRARRSE